MDVRSNHSSSGSHHTATAASVGSGGLVDWVDAPPEMLGASGGGGPPGSEPAVTHFNLDQLLEIVQSFQLDTTMASHEEAAGGRRPPIDLSFALYVPRTITQFFSLQDIKDCDKILSPVALGVSGGKKARSSGGVEVDTMSYDGGVDRRRISGAGKIKMSCRLGFCTFSLIKLLIFASLAQESVNLIYW